MVAIGRAPLNLTAVAGFVLRCLSDHVLLSLLLSPAHSRIALSMLLYGAGDWPVRGRETS